MNDFINGDIAANTIDGRAGNDSISGGDGNDTLRAGGGNDSVNGGDGDDRIVAGFGLSTFDGGTGNDTLEYQTVTFTSGVVIDLQAGTYVFQTTSLAWVGFENYVNSVTGASFEEVLGTAGANLLDFSALSGLSAITADGFNGNDTIYGSAGNDTLAGGGGVDLVEGRDGNDRFLTTGDSINDTLDGGAGNDTFVLNPNYYAGNMRGGSGDRDVIDGSTYTNVIGMNVDLAAGTYVEFGQTREATGMEDVIGGSGDDTVVEMSSPTSSMAVTATIPSPAVQAMTRCWAASATMC